MGKRWTEEDHQFLRDNYPKVDIQTLADTLGVKLAEVQEKLDKLHLLPKTKVVEERDTESLNKQSRRFSQARNEFERGIKALKQKNYEKARECFDDIVSKFTKETEFVDRAKIYLTVCERQMNPKKPDLSGPGDTYYAALIEKNRGNYPASLEHLKRCLRNGEDDRVEYLLASNYALSGDAKNALVHLEKAVGSNSQNRVQAGMDSDFESMRADRGFRKLVYRDV